MASLRWEDSMAVGVRMLDVDHRHLVDILNRLHETVEMDGSDRKLIAATVESLFEYTREHFRHEEDAMRAYDYPDRKAHEDEHEDLMRKLGELKAKADRGELTITLEIMDFLGAWLTKHMLGADKQLGLFLRSKNAP